MLNSQTKENTMSYGMIELKKRTVIAVKRGRTGLKRTGLLCRKNDGKREGVDVMLIKFIMASLFLCSGCINCSEQSDTRMDGVVSVQERTNCFLNDLIDDR